MRLPLAPGTRGSLRVAAGVALLPPDADGGVAGGIPEAVRDGIIVTIYDGDSGRISAFEDSITIDVDRSDWSQSGELWQLIRTAHQYGVVWQHRMSCQTGIRWLDTGIPEFIAYETMVLGGIISCESAANQIAQISRRDLPPLRELTESRSEVWPGNAGLVAVHRLTQRTPGGALSLRTFCAKVAANTSVPNAFKTTFGTSLDDFYADSDCAG